MRMPTRLHIEQYLRTVLKIYGVKAVPPYYLVLQYQPYTTEYYLVKEFLLNVVDLHGREGRSLVWRVSYVHHLGDG
jgi:hypothetical protein